MLSSTLFSSSTDLAAIEAGQRRMLAGEESDSVALVQQALLSVGFGLPDSGVDGIFGEETGNTVSAFKTDRVVLPADPVVGQGTIRRLDLELSFLEGQAADPSSFDATTLSLDPFFAGVLELRQGDPGIGQKAIDFFQLGDRLCFRASFLFPEGTLVILLGRMAEPFVFDDFCSLRGPCTADDFFDRTPGSTEYVDFLLAHNPQSDPARIGELGQRRRPDMLSHRLPQEWYEIKPASIAGAIAAWIKFNSIISDYADRALPYLPGTAYTPTPDIVIGRFLGPQGENLDVILETTRRAPGLVFWTLCIKGDYVLYFNRVRLAAGILAILVALADKLLAAGEAAAVVSSVRQLVQDLSIGVLPVLTSRTPPDRPKDLSY